MNSHDRFHLLMMGAVDRELNRAELLEFEALLEKNPEFRREYNEFKSLKEVTKSMKLKKPCSEVWDSYWLHVYNRIERGLAWIVFSIGAIILLVYAVFKIINNILYDTGLQDIVKIGVLFLIAGVVILFVSVVREKLYIYKTDPYREVKR